MSIPLPVGDYIDQVVLPDHADGHNTAEMIYDIQLDKSKLRIKEFWEGDLDKLPLIDRYWITLENKQRIINYINKAWKDWSE